MKANEIQIGDWVYCFDPDEPSDKQINKVSAVRVEYNEGAIKFEQLSDWFEEGWFEPIPLTAEILEKNGFEKPIPKMEYYDMFVDRFLAVEKSLERWHIRYGCCSNILSYVHELQHALRLCGLNELADNFKV